MYRSFLRVRSAFKNFLSLSCLLYVFTEEIKILCLCWLYNRTKTRISNQHAQYEYKTHLSISGTVLVMDIICRCYTCMFFFYRTWHVVLHWLQHMQLLCRWDHLQEEEMWSDITRSTGPCIHQFALQLPATPCSSLWTQW